MPDGRQNLPTDFLNSQSPPAMAMGRWIETGFKPSPQDHSGQTHFRCSEATACFSWKPSGCLKGF